MYVDDIIFNEIIYFFSETKIANILFLNKNNDKETFNNEQ